MIHVHLLYTAYVIFSEQSMMNTSETLNATMSHFLVEENLDIRIESLFDGDLERPLESHDEGPHTLKVYFKKVKHQPCGNFSNQFAKLDY